ncbi:hypothetical protein [Paraburkholderia sp. Ac-20347]|uniref:hypothetical protein n=1 Tax=Paraburkholderia sp. Ac-20347 TaxID=2703892 RepID=UPI00198109AA|nr:hypothetical protein [Paraburkholderia sp. Ac-20347]MBN3810081.1 hypothetical protein [Paraburkholderia sp. Ac-20347]
MTIGYKLAAALSVAATLTGCQVGIPYDKQTIYYDRPSFVESVTHDDPAITGQIIEHGRCTLLIGTPGAYMAPQDFCVFALTKDTLYVMKWDGKATRYERLTTVNFSDLQTVALARNFRFRQVQMTEKRRVIAIDGIVDGGAYADADASVKLFETVKAAGVPVITVNRTIEPPAVATVPYVPIFIK